MRTIRKPLSGLLAFIMIASLFAAIPFSSGAIDGVAKIGETKYLSLEDAIQAAASGATIDLLADWNVNTGSSSSSRYAISKSLTIDGHDHTITINNRGFGVGMNASAPIEVTFKDVTIHNTSNAGRCIDTRGNIDTLTLDHVTLSTAGNNSGYLQPLTIGGNQSTVATVNIIDSVIETSSDGSKGYAIITFNPVDMTISDGSTIKGWACIYAKGPDGSAGSMGSTFTVTDSTLISKNVNGGATNAFGTIVVEDSGVEVNVTDSDISIDGSANTQSLLTVNKAFATRPGDLTDIEVVLGEGNTVDLQAQGNFGTLTDENCTLKISGGTFTKEVPEEYCAPGFVPESHVDSVSGETVYGVTESIFSGHSISLNGDVDVNFYLNVTEDQIDDGVVVNFEWDKGTASYTVDSSDFVAGRGFKTLAKLPAAEMSYEITATVVIDGVEQAETNTYSVREYALATIADPNSSEELVTLMKTMLNYGAKAQDVFDRTDTVYANEGVDYTQGTVTAAMIDNAINTANGVQTASDLNDVAALLGANYYTSSLVFLYECTLRHYFTPNGAALDASLFDGVKSGYYYYVEKTDIPASQLDTLQTFDVGGVTFQWSALDFVKAIIEKYPADSAQYALAAATFWYNDAANAYFGA